MKKSDAISNLVVALCGCTVYILLAKIGGMYYMTEAGLFAAIGMFLANSLYRGISAGREVARLRAAYSLPYDFLNTSWSEFLSEGVRFLVLCSFCVVIVSISSYRFSDWWVAQGSFALVVATFTIVRPLAHLIVAAVAIWKTV